MQVRSRLYAWVLAIMATGAACGPATPPPNEGSGASATGEVAPTGDGPQGAHDVAAPPSKGCAPECQRWLEAAAAKLSAARSAGDAPNVEILYRQAGDGFVDAWRGCDLRARTGVDLACEGADAVVAEMIAAFERAGRDDGAIVGHLIALDPRWKQADGDLAQQAPAALRRLAQHAVEQSRTAPRAPGAAEGLAAAAYAHLALEEPSEAARLARSYRTRYGAQHRREAARLCTAIASYHAERGQWREALAAFHPAADPSRLDSPPEEILWHARRGQALAELGRAAQAARALKRALELWRPGEHAELAQRVGRAYPLPMLGREQVVDAVGAAHFLLAEQIRGRAAALEMPRYRGPATVKELNRHVQTGVVAWAKRRNAIVLEAEQAYRKIGQIRPVPPARWTIRAAAATGELWAEFAEAFTGSPMPQPVADDDELRAAWQTAMAEASAPAKENARRAFQRCREDGTEPGPAAEARERCTRWLEEQR